MHSQEPIVSPSKTLFFSSGIAVVTPAYEHCDTPPHDVEARPLLLDEPGTLAGKRTPSLGGILDEWGTGGPASGGSFFLGELPFLIEVESGCGGYRRSHGDEMKRILLWWKERRGRGKRRNFGLWAVGSELIY
ncbi:hypothetical protein V8G54_034991 [Vigna mungo]|uniref:Uncharacterized protein n=1 Tax=Vigna mungo TaxID=3915 RepID=A0AAQ3MEC7_VIGMU